MFDINQSIYTKNGEHDEVRERDYIEGLTEAFAESPEGRPIVEQEGSVFFARMLVEYYFGYIDGKFPRMSRRDFDEVVFSIFPRKISTEPENAPSIIAELRAFWTFLQRQYGLTSAQPILASLSGAEEKLRKALADRSNWGMAKSFFMKGKAAGYDMTSQEDMNAFMNVYNANLRANPLQEVSPIIEFLPPEPHYGPQSTKEDRQRKRDERKRKKQARKRSRK